MVEDIVIADSLHLIDLGKNIVFSYYHNYAIFIQFIIFYKYIGVMRKCLYAWVNGSYNYRTKLSAKDINMLSDMLDECNKTRPVEIHRSIRRLDSIKYWKGVEFRTFLLYLGPVVLKNFLMADVYNNFLTLFCAVTILSCKKYIKYIDVAEQLLKDYIEQFIDVYGIDAVSSNVHNLCHVARDVKKFGYLPEISSYPFENYLGQLKYLLRGGSRPLSQIGKRLIELNKVNIFNIDKNTSPNIFVKNENRFEKHELQGCQKIYNKIFLTDGFMLGNDTKNRWFLTKNQDIVSMKNATYFQKNIHIYGASLKKKYDFFKLPIKSSYLNIYASKGEEDAPKLYALSEIQCKLIAVKYCYNETVFFPLLHTLDIEIKH